jgi:hypothetical protein
MDKHRALRLAVLVFIVAIAGACGDIDDGTWSHIPAPTPTSPISEVAPSPAASMNGVAVAHGTELVPSAQPDRLHWLRCDLAPASPIDIQMAGQPIAFHANEVCFSNSTLCQQTQTYEAHAASIASCWALAQKVIAAKSKDRLGDHWAAKVMPLLPAVWSTSVAQVNTLTSRISGGMVDLITGGTGMSTAQGAPLCFPTYGAKAELATTTAVNQVTSLVNGTEKNVEMIKSALLRGIDVQVDYDFHLTLSVKFGELPSSLVQPLQCDFTK